ncbi:phage tail protein [Teredinibacter franksiae]|uniref:phage tail protein n=1 Tax=Teredinibacter franksiae TaxID=2761453 RepID=UPI001C8ADD96|nr:phage tail protein [Teredinibacter franksiae]
MPAPFMMLLGPIRFSVDQASYQQLQRTTQYSWATQSPLGHPVLKYLGLGGPTRQYIGPGEDSITLNGTIFPQFNGGPLQLIIMRLSAGIGIALPLICGNGLIMGRWIIESIGETKSEFFDNGAARKIEFNLTLKRFQQDFLPGF